MGKNRLFIVFLVNAVCSLILTGCNIKELEQARAKTVQTELELANTKELLTKSEKDRESLQTKLDAVNVEREKLIMQVKEWRKRVESLSESIKEAKNERKRLDEEYQRLKSVTKK